MAFYVTMLWVIGVSKIAMHNPRPYEVLNDFDGWNEQHSLEDRAIQGSENWYWRYDAKWPCSHSFGMPSGHTASTSYVVWHLAYYFTFKDSSANQNRSCLKKISIWSVAMVIAISVGYSRIFLARHTFNQVVIGAATAFFLFALESYSASYIDEYLEKVLAKGEIWEYETRWINRI
jgi:membrane-associated phospholipid phosphatase